MNSITASVVNINDSVACRGESSTEMMVPDSLTDGFATLIGLHQDGVELQLDYCVHKSKYEYERLQKDLPKSLYTFVENFPEFQDDFEKVVPVLQIIEDWELIRKMPRTQKKLLIKILQKS